MADTVFRWLEEHHKVQFRLKGGVNSLQLFRSKDTFDRSLWSPCHCSTRDTHECVHEGAIGVWMYRVKKDTTGKGYPHQTAKRVIVDPEEMIWYPCDLNDRKNGVFVVHLGGTNELVMELTEQEAREKYPGVIDLQL